MNSTSKLFVYGTLRSEFHQHTASVVTEFFNLLGNARAKGMLYDLDEYPGATVSDSDSFIIGELYELKPAKDFDAAFKQLDDYEGYLVNSEKESLYLRKETEVLYENRICSAWMYWYNRDVYGKKIIESGDYLNWLAIKNN